MEHELKVVKNMALNSSLLFGEEPFLKHYEISSLLF